jgi:ATP-dependent protease ClpP protease subunit
MTKDISQRSQLIHDIHDYCINPDTREIYLHGYLGDGEEEVGVDYRMAVRFEKNLLFLNGSSDEPITVHMHTIGGAWHDGIGIFDTIRSSRCEVTIIGYAEVSSMSSVILQAADVRLLRPNTSFIYCRLIADIELDSTAISP